MKDKSIHPKEAKGFTVVKKTNYHITFFIDEISYYEEKLNIGTFSLTNFNP